MKHLLTTSAFLLAATAAMAKEKKVPDITGNWKETTRMARDKKSIAFTDTMFTDFMIGNEFITGRSTGFKYKGTFKVSNESLDMGMRMYTITERTPSRMVLKDDAGFYVWEKYTKADPSVENSGAAASGSRGHQETNLDGGPVAFSQLKGKWEVFKRTSSETLPEVNYKMLLHTLDIKGERAEDSSGIYAAADPTRNPGWFITGYANNVIHCKGPTGERELNVLKCEFGELIVQEGSVTYFFKQFRK